MAPDIKYMTLEEVSDLLGVTYQLIYRLVRTGELPAVRVGRVYRVTGRDLDAYLESTRASATAIAGTCAACGKSYRSALSLPHECAECGKPMCVDCWERKGERTCKEHRKSKK